MAFYVLISFRFFQSQFLVMLFIINSEICINLFSQLLFTCIVKKDHLLFEVCKICMNKGQVGQKGDATVHNGCLWGHVFLFLFPLLHFQILKSFVSCLTATYPIVRKRIYIVVCVCIYIYIYALEIYSIGGRTLLIPTLYLSLIIVSIPSISPPLLSC